MAAKKGGLGRGLGSLFEESAAGPGAAGEGVQMLRLSEISPDKNQPRRAFDEAALAELASSVAQHGVLQPIVVRPLAAGGYQIIAGERRWRAARQAGLKEIPALVKEIGEEKAMEIALVENLQREDLDPVEEAQGFRQLMERTGCTQEAAAARVGKSRSAVANSLRLLNLAPPVLALLRQGRLTTGHAKALLGLPEAALQCQAADTVVEKGLNVRQTERLCRALAKPQAPKKPALRPVLPTEVELSLAEALGTRVSVQYKEGKGTLQVHFNSDEQLRDFANLLGHYQKERG